MVQMGDNASCSRAMSNVNNCYIFNSKLNLGSVCVWYAIQLFVSHITDCIKITIFMHCLQSHGMRVTSVVAVSDIH